MTVRVDALPVSLPDLRAVRWSSDGLHVGFKESYALGRITRGTSEWSRGSERWVSRPGSLQLLAPGDVCRDRARGPSVRQVIFLPASLVERAVGRVHVTSQLEHDDPRGAPFQRLHDAIARRADRLALEVALTEALAALGDLAPERRDLSRPVARALDFLRDRLDERIRLDQLAERADLDKFRLCRAFRAEVGLPPHAYLTRLRVARAKELLARGLPPITVAAQTGFYDQSQLTHHFQRLVGVTPARYAKRIREDATSADAL